MKTNINPSSVQLAQMGVTVRNRDILQDVSIFFGPGLHTLVGLNGSGKSTLLKALYGFWPYSGSVLLNNRELFRIPPKDRARLIAVAPQENPAQFDLTVREFVLLGRFPYVSWLHVYSSADKKIADQALDYFGITPLAARPYAELSGGERQKAVLARVYCQDTPVWLLDEPDLNLDPRSLSELYNLLEQEAAQGRTIICASHDLRLAKAGFVTQIAGLREGRLAWKGHPEDTGPDFLDTVFGPWPANLRPYLS